MSRCCGNNASIEPGREMGGIFQTFKVKNMRLLCLFVCRGKLVHQSQRVGKEKSTPTNHTKYYIDM